MDYKYIPFYVQGNAVTGMYYGQWGMAEDRDIEYVKEMYPLTFMTIQELSTAACESSESASQTDNPFYNIPPIISVIKPAN